MSQPGADPAGLRIDYPDDGLSEADLAATWPEQFARWFADAVAAGITEPNAVVLATTDADGMPDARLVLFKAWDASGFVVFTNADSAKGRQLAARPYAALVVPWHPMYRQVRVRGAVEAVAAEESDAYFASRPWGARIAARVSRQSQRIDGRGDLEAAWAEQAAAHPDGTDVPRPEGWQGYRVVPDTVEFWSGRHNRLHDRLRFRRTGTGPGDHAGDWVVERLAP